MFPARIVCLFIDQHALHERLNYDSLFKELQDREYQSQQLAVPIMIEVAPSQVKLLESNLPLFGKLGIELEPFGGTTFQATAVCHLYDEKLVRDAIYRILDEVAGGSLRIGSLQGRSIAFGHAGVQGIRAWGRPPHPA